MAKIDDATLAELGLDDIQPAKNDAFGRVFDSFEGENDAQNASADRVQPPKMPHWTRGCLPAGCVVLVVGIAGLVVLVVAANLGRQPSVPLALPTRNRLQIWLLHSPAKGRQTNYDRTHRL